MMPLDYIVSSLPSLTFGANAPISWEAFVEIAGKNLDTTAFNDLETQLRNAIAQVRGGGEKSFRPAKELSLYWKNRILACFQEKDILKRDELVDKVWWDAAGELTNIASPLGAGALATYAVRLKIALKRSKISKEAGLAVFDRIAAEANIGSEMPTQEKKR